MKKSDNLIAIDCVNGMTYVGKDMKIYPQKLWSAVFGWVLGDHETISGYSVFQSGQGFYQKDPLKVSNYGENLRDAHLSKEKNLQGPLTINHKKIVAVHNLDDLDDLPF